MKTLLAVTGLLLLWPATSVADIYRCESDSGVRYADTPCGDQSEKIILQDNRIGGNFGQNLPDRPDPEQRQTSETARERSDNDTCQFINSTDLRRYLIREQVVKGMTRENVQDAFGRPPETYPTPQETWVYQTKYFGALTELTYVYFRDGCVENVVYRKP
jgi:hypothetical protein